MSIFASGIIAFLGWHGWDKPKSKIEVLKSIIQKIDDLSNELVLAMDSSDDHDVDNLIGDMENLIKSVKDYNWV